MNDLSSILTKIIWILNKIEYYDAHKEIIHIESLGDQIAPIYGISEYRVLRTRDIKISIICASHSDLLYG